jgi:hypothetical protein
MRSRRHPRTTWLGRVIRGLLPDRNPLRRDMDRAETAIGAALLAIFAAAAPLVAHTAANTVSDMSRQQLRAEQAFNQVRATLLEAPMTIPAYGTAFAPQADARWTAPDGQVRTGLVTVPADATKGSTVPIWTDRSGQPVTPLRPDQIQTQEVIAAVAAVTLLATLLLLAAWTARQALNRRRMADWDADWLATGPRWTSRR